MAKFKKISVIIDAMQYHDGHFDDLRCFIGYVPPIAQRVLTCDGSGVLIRTLEGDMRVSDGDWVIKGVQGEFYPCKPDIFKQTYEVCEE